MPEEVGHTALAASSGQMALEILRSSDSIDLVITDQVMPEMTGTDLAKAIRAEWPKPPAILASGIAEAPSDIGALTRMSKPFTRSIR
jgi:CheY-like chemotaxis protein